MQKRLRVKKQARDREIKKVLDQIGLIDPWGLIRRLKSFRVGNWKLFRKLRIGNWKFVCFLGFGLLAIMSIYILWGLPNPTSLTRHPSPASTRLLDRHSRLIYEFFADQRRTPIKLDSLPKYVIQAHLAAEDKDFYSHSGVSLRGISRAFINTFFRRNLQGGSTITQQLVKNALLTTERTLKRKIREFTLSLAVEALYSKDQILELYLNQVPYGGTAYGLESAARTYFDKSAKELTLAEAALLAGLPQAPSYYSPFGAHPEAAKSRQEYVLSQMEDSGFLTPEEHQAAKDAPLNYVRDDTLSAPHFALWVKDRLVEKYGLQTVEEGGLTVVTTLDLELQHFAQNAVATEVARLTREKVGNGAALVTHPQTGEILSMVGSRDYFDSEHDGAVNVTLRPRQPGSSIKPLNYSLALDRRLLTAASLLADKPTCFLSPNQKPYCPDNYDNQFHGPTQVRFALGNSFNLPAVKTLVINGLSDFLASSSAYGITTFKDPKSYGPSITLGGGEVTMLDMATAYGVLANAGQRVDLNPLIRVTDRTGKILEEVPLKTISSEEAAELNPLDTILIGSQAFVKSPPPNTRVISSGAAFITSHILYDPGARAATFGSTLNVPQHPEVSVKTGTTNDLRDNWTIGYNPDVLVAVWVGNNDNTAMSRVASGITGASPIWKTIISHALADYPQNWPSRPVEVVGATVCNYSGLRAPDSPDPTSCPTRYEFFISGTQPGFQTDNSRRDIPIFRPTQSPASSKQIVEQPGDIETQNHLVVFDALGTALCLDCAGGYGAADDIRLDDRGRATR